MCDIADKYAEFYKRMALLEINTIWKFEESRGLCGKKEDCQRKICGVLYEKTYSNRLELFEKFSDIKWEEDNYKALKVLKEKPPEELFVIKNEDVEEILFIPVKFKKTDGSGCDKPENWEHYIQSFVRVRNNITHGAKFLYARVKNDNPHERDKELIDAALAFISFLEKNIIKARLE